MPTNTNAYNSRVTDEALEKRFRDTFRSQGGAELVDDLYAQGVIVPVVDFTAAATGQQLAQNLQTAWDFSTGHSTVSGASTTIINNAGFWQIGLTVGSADPSVEARLYITDSLTTKTIWRYDHPNIGGGQNNFVLQPSFVAFVRSGDSIIAQTTGANTIMEVWYRQIADLSGNLTNPSGFTSS